MIGFNLLSNNFIEYVFIKVMYNSFLLLTYGLHRRFYTKREFLLSQEKYYTYLCIKVVK